MKNLNKFIIIGCILLSIIILIVLWLYWNTFWNRPISEDSAQWGQFGDYIWWTLNPILGLLNLIVLLFISINVAKIEEDRNARNLKPLGNITTHLINEKWSLVSIEILIKNCWLWPMIIKNISIEKSWEKYSNFFPISKKIVWWYICSSYDNEDEGVLTAWESITLGKFEIPHESYWIMDMKPVLDIIREYTISIEYTDMYEKYSTINKNIWRSLSSVWR